MNNSRSIAAFVHDILAVVACWGFSFVLRFNFDVPSGFVNVVLPTLLWIIPLYAVSFLVFGLYRGLWRFASLSDMQHLAAAVGLAGAGVSLTVLFFHLQFIPRSVLIMHPILVAVVMGGSRFAYRSWKEHHLYGPSRLRGRPVIVIGVNDSADSLLREMHRSGQWYAVALLDDNSGKHGRYLRRLPIISPISSVGETAKKYDVADVVIAMPEAKASERRRVTELAVSAGLNVLTVPSYTDLLSGRLSVSHIRKVELEDLLGRDAVDLDTEGLHRLLTGKVVLVTGAGGSIGAELCRQIAILGPQKLVLVDISEFALYAIDDELHRTYPDLNRCACAADVRDAERLDEIFSEERPEVVFHAAAYKHVPLMEGRNAWQALRINTLGTWRVAKAAIESGVTKFVLVSTDKAVNPTNIMGASKRLAEMLCRSLDNGEGTRFITVRFGNVLGSNGSVIPRFREQIAQGGPVTVTHPDIVRYFMTIPEASQLVLQAGLMGAGSEIFVLEMGEPVKILDLARDMIRLSGFSDDEIRIDFTGLRPGEKLFEELLAGDETTVPTHHPKLRIARFSEALSVEASERLISWLEPGVRSVDEIKTGLCGFVPGYSPACNAQTKMTERPR